MAIWNLNFRQPKLQVQAESKRASPPIKFKEPNQLLHAGLTAGFSLSGYDGRPKSSNFQKSQSIVYIADYTDSEPDIRFGGFGRCRPVGGWRSHPGTVQGIFTTASAFSG